MSCGVNHKGRAKSLGASVCRLCRREVSGQPGDVKACVESFGVLCQGCAVDKRGSRYEPSQLLG
jgi:hypothetical protein